MSDQLLPKNPANTSGINVPSEENQRLAFLSRLADPCLFSTTLCVKSYIDSALVADNYQYQYLSKSWKKNGVTNSFSGQELFVLCSHTEQNSFVTQVVNVIISDAEWNVTQQQAIEDDANSTSQQKTDARNARFKFKTIVDNLKDYKTRFLNYDTISNEILMILQQLMAINE